jgi:hypothetical protein
LRSMFVPNRDLALRDDVQVDKLILYYIIVSRNSV